MKKIILLLLAVLLLGHQGYSSDKPGKDFAVQGFHLDLRVQVMTMDALKEFATKLSKSGINTIVMEWEATYPFQKHPMISNRYAYSPEEIRTFINFCKDKNIQVIPLQQSFGHVEYILRNYRYSAIRESQKDFSQVCPIEVEGNRALFTDLFTELASTHPSNYLHIGGDETYLLGNCPKCIKKAKEVGKSRLYIDHIKMLCDIAISLGKRPVLWADIALKYPEAISLLPKETVFIDWNYGWGLDKFGDHAKLMESGYEIWGAPALRSHPDNFFLTQWEKHFNNIRDFLPMARKLGYKGMVMTSWSTSGIYSSVYESATDMVDLYAIRRVYPLQGFNILLSAYLQSIGSEKPLDVNAFIRNYTKENYGFNADQATQFWKALKTAPWEYQNGVVKAPTKMTIDQLIDSVEWSANIFDGLKPVKNKEEFEHYRLMTDIRLQFLKFKAIEDHLNSEAFTADKIPAALEQLGKLKANFAALDKRFLALNKGFIHPSELEFENQSRNARIQLTYDRLARTK